MTTIETLTSPSGRILVLAPQSELRANDVSALCVALRGAPQGARLVVLDLLNVAVMDPSVVAVLVGAAEKCRGHGVQFVVANADRQPWTTLTQAKLAGVLRLHRRGAEPLADLLQLLEL